MSQLRNLVSLLAVALFLSGALATAHCQTLAPPSPTARPTPPTRDPLTPGYVTAKQLSDGAVPPANADGNFVLGPTHNPAPELAHEAALAGSVIEFTMKSADSKIYPGIARDPGTFGTVDPATTGFSPTRIWRRCSRTRVTTISSCLYAMPVTSIAP